MMKNNMLTGSKWTFVGGGKLLNYNHGYVVILDNAKNYGQMRLMWSQLRFRFDLVNSLNHYVTAAIAVSDIYLKPWRH